jgi:hypothetical protein
VLSLHQSALQAYQSGNMKQAFNYEHEALLELKEVFHADKTGVNVPILLVVARNLRVLAYQSGQLETAEATIKKGLVACIASKNKQKKWGSIEMGNQLMWIYFHLTKLSLCGSINDQVIRATSRMGNMSMEQIPMSHRVTSQYYRGRLALFNLDPVGAKEALDFAFEHCTIDSPKNKRLILHSLVPTNLLHGIYPTQSLLEKYHCTQYINLVESVKKGNIGMFEECITKYQIFFIKKGMFMLIPWIRMLLYRNLFYTLSKINKEHKDANQSTSKSKSNILDLSQCETIMTSLSNGGKQYDTNMVQCILAGLIDHGFIKGYISHGLNKMVLKKNKATDAIEAFVPIRASMFKK